MSHLEGGIVTNRVEDGRDDLPFMVHSELDDIGLDPFEFRVYAHAVRRAGGESGELWESVEAGAAHCRMDVKTYRAALVALVKLRLLSRKDRPGQTSVYRLTPRSAWLATPTKNGRATESGRGTGNGRGTPTKNGRTPLPETVDKGNPLKGIPGRESPKTYTREPKPKKPTKKTPEPAHEFDPATVDLPPQFDRELFQAFCSNRLKKKSPMTLEALRRFLKKHGKHNKATLDQMFDNAIIAGWKDLYPLKNDRSHAKASSRDDLADADDFKNPVDPADLLGVGRL